MALGAPWTPIAAVVRCRLLSTGRGVIRAAVVPLVIVCLAAPVLAGCARSSGPSATPAPSHTPDPTASPSPTPRVTPEPTIAPTASPTVRPPGAVGTLELQATSCPGGVVLEWSALSDAEFHHYTVLRSPSEVIEPHWPPVAPAVDWGETFATDPFVTAAVDASIIPSTRVWNYRAMAYDALDRPIAASPVRQAWLDPVFSLGALSATPADDGRTHLTWSAFVGFPGCFSWYAVVASRTSDQPSSLSGSPSISTISSRSTTELSTEALESGATYFLRVQAIRATPMGEFLVAQTSVTTYTAP